MTDEAVGVVSLSASEKAGNVWIAGSVHVAGITGVMDGLEGRAKKAAVFAGREVVEG